MKIVQDNLWLCHDCLFGAVNGDFSGLEPGQLARVQTGLERLGPHLVSDFDSETGDGMQEFSWSHCDCCRSPLGGSRHRFAVLGPEDAPPPSRHAPECPKCGTTLETLLFMGVQPDGFTCSKCSLYFAPLKEGETTPRPVAAIF
jgi:hypothetical protein